MTANVVFLPPAEKYFKKLRDKKLKARFKQKIEQIADDPLLGAMKQGDLSGIRSCDIHYNKTNYELAYYVGHKGKETVVVVMAGTRENFYEALKAYMKSS